MSKKSRSQKRGLIILFSSVLFLTLICNTIISGFVVYILVKTGIVHIASEATSYTGLLVVTMAVISVMIGFIATLITVKFPLKPIRELIDGMNKLVAGEFETRIKAGSIMRKNPTFVAIADSFNKMAEELESTEMLRSDFINNFSHEFKTPIVSITGFAKLLKKGNINDEQRREYIDAIEEESMRLSYMATNVLNLTKVENQSILTDVTEYNLSEQIRSCVLLLERKWEEKNLELQMDFDEYMINANEELLRQVWINIIDNAVKFTPDGQMIGICIFSNDQYIRVDIKNTGVEIPEENQKHIFKKFYQGDCSHATQGNGVGLAIVKRIVELHRGKVELESHNNITVFTVILPQ